MTIKGILEMKIFYKRLSGENLPSTSFLSHKNVHVLLCNHILGA